jgi:transcriptional regulator of acetoin/glycerol metabolism
METHLIRQVRHDVRWASAIMRRLEKDLAWAIQSDANVMMRPYSGSSAPWTGNLRELQSAAETLAVQDPARRLEVGDLPSHIH